MCNESTQLPLDCYGLAYGHLLLTFNPDSSDDASPIFLVALESELLQIIADALIILGVVLYKEFYI